MAMDLGDAKITISVNDKASQQMQTLAGKTEALGKRFRTLGKVMVGVGIAIAGALTAAVVSYAKAGDEVHKMALRTGFATETLSELRHAAELSGSSLSSIDKAVKKMSKTIIDADRGLETYVRTFDELGLDIKELRALNPEEQFWAIANAIANLEDQTLKAAIAQEVFGRAGTELLPMLAQGSVAIDEMRQQAHELGIVFDEEGAAAAARLNDAMTTLKEATNGVSIAFAEQLAPAISDFLENKAIPAITAIKDWVAENEGLAKSLLVVAGVLGVGGALLLGLGMISRAIIAINTALIIMHGLMGPAAWAKLAAGLVIATGAIIAMKQLTKPDYEGAQVTPEAEAAARAYAATHEVPSFQYGGIVPGPIGAPVPIIAHGGEQFAGVGKSMGGTNIYIGSFMGDESSLRTFAKKIQDIMGQNNRRTSFSGINKWDYFPGSSSV